MTMAPTMGQPCQRAKTRASFRQRGFTRDSPACALYKAAMTERLAEVVRARMLSPSVRALELRCTDGAPLGHQAGQWVNLHVPLTEASAPVRRAYSVASAPKPAPSVLLGAPRDEGTFEIAVTRVQDGAASIALHALPVGALLGFDGPHGFFTREAERDEPALLVGTGTGLCPLRAMIEEELSRPEGPPIALLFGCRTEADRLWHEQLEALARAHTRFSLHVTLSRPAEGWQGLTGYVQAALPERARAMGSPLVYACGLSRMVQEVRRVLKDELGYDRKRIRSERYD
jgi:CDP-4-dehydro-6-deoxyglucose reductase